MKTSGFKEYRLKKDDKYYAKEIKALEVFNQYHLEHASSIVFGVKTNVALDSTSSNFADQYDFSEYF